MCGGINTSGQAADNHPTLRGDVGSKSGGNSRAEMRTAPSPYHGYGGPSQLLQLTFDIKYGGRIWDVPQRLGKPHRFRGQDPYVVVHALLEQRIRLGPITLKRWLLSRAYIGLRQYLPGPSPAPGMHETRKKCRTQRFFQDRPTLRNGANARSNQSAALPPPTFHQRRQGSAGQ
jgi:hypothetical protein